MTWHGFEAGQRIARDEVVAICEKHIRSGGVKGRRHHLEKLEFIRNCDHETIVYSPFGPGYANTPLNPSCWKTTDGGPISPPRSVSRYTRSAGPGGEETFPSNRGTPFIAGNEKTVGLEPPLDDDASDALPADFDPELVAEDRERTMRSITDRRGQAEFRTILLKTYGGRCAISKISVPEVLEAAHISPYRGDETNHPQNGILLRSDLHTLFDLGLITISDDFKVEVHAALKDTPYQRMHGKKIRLPTLAADRPSKNALSWHRDHARLRTP